jgi:hypothetical protein
MTNGIYAALLGVIGGFVFYGVVWAFLVSNFAKTEADKVSPPWPVVLASA